MNFNRILALLQYDFTILTRSKWKNFETFYFPIVSLLIWGLFTLYVKSFALELGFLIFIINIFWNFSHLSQITVSSPIMEDIWSRSLKELLITPLKISEFITARIIISFLRVSVVFLILIFGSYFLFSIDFVINHFYFLAFLALLSFLASVGLGLLVSAFVIRFGSEYGFLSWSILQIIIFLSAPFYPISIFPDFIQPLVMTMPYTWTFESVKTLVATGVIDFSLVTLSIISSLIYFVIAFPAFFYIFERAREKGRIVRLWT